MTTVALLPFKANSERIKNKNFKNFAGKPLFKWMLDKLENIDYVDKIIINTDASDKIRNMHNCESNKIILRERKSTLSGDFTSMNLIIEDDINNINADNYIMTHTTNPLLKEDTIINALDIYNMNNGIYDSLFSVNKYQTRFYSKDGTAVNHDPSKLIRTQDLEPWYEENSNLYIFNRESFRKTNSRIGVKPYLYETGALESQDIDNQENWDIAESIAKNDVV